MKDSLTIKNHIAEDSTELLRNEVEKVSCLYMFGQTAFNPITDTHYYWVKVGLTTNLRSRISNYNSSNPAYYPIDFKGEGFYDNDIYKAEIYYHQILAKISFARSRRNTEWWLVDKDTYLQICNKGFEYLDNIPHEYSESYYWFEEFVNNKRA